MNFDERNSQIEKLYLEDEWSMEKIGEKFGVSRNRVKQILWELGVKGKQERANRKVRLIEKMRQTIDSQPDLTNSEVAEQLAVTERKLKNALKTSDIKRDKAKILSRIKLERGRKGRALLTEDLLTRLYLTERKTIEQIAAELNYSPSTISFNLIRLGIKTRRPGRRAKS